MRCVRGIIVGVDDSAAIQRVQVQYGPDSQRDVTGWLERLQPVGLSSVPAARDGSHGCEALVLEVAPGVEKVLVTDDRRNRPTGGAHGDRVLWDDHGNRAELRDGKILVVAAPGSYVEVQSDDVRLGNGADAALVRWPDLQAFLQGLVLQVSGTANLTSGAVTATTAPPSVPSMGTTKVKAK